MIQHEEHKLKLLKYGLSSELQSLLQRLCGSTCFMVVHGDAGLTRREIIIDACGG